MRKIALILAMLLIPCVSFAGLLGSSKLDHASEQRV